MLLTGYNDDADEYRRHRSWWVKLMVLACWGPSCVGCRTDPHGYHLDQDGVSGFEV
jgi:hypothetical protein